MSLRSRRRLFCTILSPALLLRPLLSRDHLSSPPLLPSILRGDAPRVPARPRRLRAGRPDRRRLRHPPGLRRGLGARRRADPCPPGTVFTCRPVVWGDGCHGLHWAAGEKGMVPSPPPQHHHRNGDGGSSSGKASPVVSPLAGMGRALGLPSTAEAGRRHHRRGRRGPDRWRWARRLQRGRGTNERTREQMGIMWRRVIWSRHDEDGTDCHARSRGSAGS